MKFPHSIQNRIIKLFVVFTFFLSLVYSLFLLNYSWGVEEAIFYRLVANEEHFITEYYKENEEIPSPRLSFVTAYTRWQDLPVSVFQQHQLDPHRIEFELPGGGGIHIKTIVLGGNSVILAIDVTTFEVGKDYLPIISKQLVILLLIITVIALFVSFMVSRSAIRPLKRLTEKVESSKNTKINKDFSAEFEQNEVGFLAQTFETSILHLQNVLQRESDFTRDVSHELRTPITILRNLELKTREAANFNEKDSRQFHFAITQMQQTVTTLLALAREESLHIESVLLLSVLEDCVINHYELNQKQNFNLNVDIPANLQVQANENLLKILINNLLSNAVNYSSGKVLDIRFADNNIYFENKRHPIELNEPFSANSKGENSLGIGLGLNLVKRVCDLFNWQVNLDKHDDSFCLVITIIPNGLIN